MDGVYDFLFGDKGYTPHAFCMIWDKQLVYTHAISDGLIAISYLVIPYVLLSVRRINPGLLPTRVLYLFIAFIVTCGVTHVFGVITLYKPIYGVSSIIKMACALASMLAAGFLIINYHAVQNIPSMGQLIRLNQALEKEVAEREQAEHDLLQLSLSLDDQVKKQTAELRSAVELEQKTNSKLEALVSTKDFMVASISHDFKTPLNAILGFSEMIQQKYFGDKVAGKNAEYIDNIHRAGQTLKGHVTRLLDVFRLEDEQYPMDITEFDVDDAVREVAVLLEPKCTEKNINVEINVDEGLAYSGDRYLITRLISNLITNAVQYSDRGTVRISAVKSDGGFKLTVSDQGRGMTKEEQDVVFNTFQTLDEKGLASAGHGIGLATCKLVAEKHGGRISVQSTPGVGSVFSVILPDLPI